MNWDKLFLRLQFLKNAKFDKMRLMMDENRVVKWCLDALLDVHNEVQSQSGAVMTLGKGTAQIVTTKQKTKTRSTIEEELISLNNIVSKAL
jgi:hypothetical protein